MFDSRSPDHLAIRIARLLFAPLRWITETLLMIIGTTIMVIVGGAFLIAYKIIRFLLQLATGLCLFAALFYTGGWLFFVRESGVLENAGMFWLLFAGGVAIFVALDLVPARISAAWCNWRRSRDNAITIPAAAFRIHPAVRQDEQTPQPMTATYYRPKLPAPEMQMGCGHCRKPISSCECA